MKQEKSAPDDTNNIVGRLYQIRAQIVLESKGQIFEDSTELIRQMREERTKYLEELHELA